jgi:hypothetical protein
MENVDEIVTFYHFAERGLALPSCSFFRGLLYYYGLELHHLNPNSICHISIFVHFCEAFLGIESHWDLFRFLFRVKPQPTSKKLSVVGGASIQLRQQAGERYLSYKFPSNLPGWKNHWFYSENHAPQLPEKTNNPPVVRPEWNLELSGGNMDQVKELLDLIEAHKMTGVPVLPSCFLSSNAESNRSYSATDLDSSTQALKIHLACAQRSCQMTPSFSESGECWWTWTPCRLCRNCLPRGIRPSL